MLEIRSISKTFGTTVAVDELDLTVFDREVLALLGPSGCGKSTLLRIVAGLDTPDRGTVHWDGADITYLPTHERRFGLMFQSYALFPHRNVGENVGFGLRMLGLERDQIRERVSEALSWVDLAGFEGRPIDGLSGGEQQRVALARTLAPSPRLVMLDEPVGALDRRLRERLVIDTAGILRDRGATAIYVTHDHDEAAAVSDRVAIMRAGSIVQTGPLHEIREHPSDGWVADFVG